ncbi:hypothetical protein Y487_11305 [Listeria monocytogenes]|uniref:hypothetical protein n=1 Tax=Listeria monocytogenes TaxID=1639 RepID=UPI0010DC72DE|nr:hypothetical protein [Listeria monocytogenes]EAC9890483.1 hypothetical protein [Listeria monocytogenes]
MRFRQIENTLTISLPKLSYTVGSTNTNAQHVNVVGKADVFIPVLVDLHKLNIFIKPMKDLNELCILQKVGYEKLHFDNQAFVKFKNAIEEIRFSSESILNTIHICLPSQESQSITVQLPEYTDLENITLFFKEINSSLELFSNATDGKKIKVQNFDSGSRWIEFIIESQEYLKLFGLLIDTCVNCYTHYQHYKMVKKAMENSSSNDELKAEIIDPLKALFLKNIEQEMQKGIENNNGEELSPENLLTLVKSEEIITRLMGEGATFQPSYNAPIETKDSFPQIEDIQNLKLTADRFNSQEDQKRITEE